MARIYMNPGAAKEVIERIFTSKAIENEVFNPESPLSDNPFKVTSDGYEDLTVVELKELLKAKGLSTGGNKADLIQRLRLDGAGPDPSEVAPADAAATKPPQKEANVSESEENSPEKPVIE